MAFYDKVLATLKKGTERGKELFWKHFAERAEPMSADHLALAHELLEAMEEWKIAQVRFDEAQGEEVEWAVFALKAASTRYGALVQRAKEEGISLGHVA